MIPEIDQDIEFVEDKDELLKESLTYEVLDHEDKLDLIDKLNERFEDD